VKLTPGDQNIVLVTKNGMSIKFDERNVRSMGRTTQGVKGIKLAPEDEVLGMEIELEGGYLLVLTEQGYGKRTPLSKYPRQIRGGKGVKTLRVMPKRGKLAGARIVKEDHGLMVVSGEGILIRMLAKGIPVQGRNTQGVKIMNIRKDDKVGALARIVTSQEEEAVAEKGEAV